ncbi:GIY-YIG nuclease family protein [Dialister sp.]|uniref:GIY-YIG nuclease family protein n=1 Tax=Dialister sp. TaxID=1955814 RepID=UPI002E81B3AF|nr:GIY-YIG nuclease family protein [Dialister sp.]MEE3453299.1 GIY-YIG nuclease family protein [Dialister sp.]
MVYGKSIELFLVNGSAESIITAELSNWNGKAIKIPRIEIANCGREDIAQVGVYFLFCKGDDGPDSVYIGESENVKERLLQHIRDYQSEKEKYYWTTAVIFTGRDLNKALIRYLENRLVEIAKSCNRYTMLTKNTYQNTVVKESQKASMEEFIDNIRILINTLGYKVLEPVLVPESENENEESDDKLLKISSTTAYAYGMETSEGFVVLKGAKVNPDTYEKSLTKGLIKLRTKIFDEGKVKDLVTTEDLLFSSSSAAADFVLGYSVSGPQMWKTKDGRTLKEINMQETGA